MEALSRYYPELYRYLCAYEPQKMNLVITENGKVDIKYGETFLYNGDAEAFAKKEVTAFLEQYPVGQPFPVVASANPDNYGNPRLSSRFISTSFPKTHRQDLCSPITLKGGYPAIMFINIGLGFQLKEIIDYHAVTHIIIVEPIPDFLYFSMFTLDWAAIIAFYQKNQFRLEITFEPSAQSELDERQLYQQIWNSVVRGYPLYPATAHFYNHRNSPRVNNIIEAVKQNYPYLYSSWGNYDDECNQLNQALHNLSDSAIMENSRPVSECMRDEPHSQLSNKPVCVIGSGPSLDRNIEALHQIRDSITLISCGSGISVLYKQGIVPDYHCELESDYKVTVGTYAVLQREGYLDQVTLIAPIQINPYVNFFFKKTLFFNRDSGAVSGIFKDRYPVLDCCSPTCTNLGLSFAIYMKANCIVLMGMDFGFRELEKHHAEQSVYYNEAADKVIVEANDRVSGNLFKQEDVNGKLIWTRPDFYYAKWRVEVALERYNDGEVYNASDGLKIARTVWLESGDALRQMVADVKRIDVKGAATPRDELRLEEHGAQVDPMDSGRKTFSDPDGASTESPTAISPEGSAALIKSIHLQLCKVNRDLSRILDIEVNNPIQLIQCINSISRYMELKIQLELPEAYNLITGTVCHFLHVGISTLLAEAQSEASFRDNATQWIETFRSFFKAVTSHFKERFSEQGIDSDSTLKLSIIDPLEFEQDILDHYLLAGD